MSAKKKSGVRNKKSQGNRGRLLAISLAVVALGLWSWVWVSGSLKPAAKESESGISGQGSLSQSGESTAAEAEIEPTAKAEPESTPESETEVQAESAPEPEKEAAASSEGGEQVSEKPESILSAGVSISERDSLTYLTIEGHEMLLVNKSYSLPSNYGSGILPEAQAAFDSMAAAAYQDGYTIWIGSGFRDYETQEVLFNRYSAQSGEAAANRFSARPGHSEHQSGLAMDVAGGDGSTFLKTAFEDTAEFAWLDAHAADYGFILRYLKDREWATGYIYEPWHYRYVGTELAHILKDSGLSVEEYAGLASA